MSSSRSGPMDRGGGCEVTAWVEVAVEDAAIVVIEFVLAEQGLVEKHRGELYNHWKQRKQLDRAAERGSSGQTRQEDGPAADASTSQWPVIAKTVTRH